MPAAVANDAAWGGWGWCLATHEGPVACGHLALAGRTWRWHSLEAVLTGAEPVHAPGRVWPPTWEGCTWPDLLVEAAARTRPGEHLARVVVEQPPAVYSGASRGGKGKRAGNQAATGYGMGLLVGNLLRAGCRPGELAAPWEVEVNTWRPWWGVTGRDRGGYKAAAIFHVRARTWGAFVEPFEDTGDDHGPRGDVGEAILQAVGAARHAGDGPRGPAKLPTHLPTR